MRTLLYSGSFDPLHIGHLAILRSLCADPGVGRVLLVVSPQNPFKNPEKALSAEKRFRAAVLAVARHTELDKVCVSDIELHMAPPHYTIRTLDALRAECPDDDIRLVIGADNLGCIRGWYQYRRILLEYGALVFPRRGYDIAGLRQDLLSEDALYRIYAVDAEQVDISSTDIRNAVSQGKDVSDLLM